MGVPPNGWFISKGNPIKMDDLEVPLFQETTMCPMDGFHAQFIGEMNSEGSPTKMMMSSEIPAQPWSHTH